MADGGDPRFDFNYYKWFFIAESEIRKRVIDLYFIDADTFYDILFMETLYLMYLLYLSIGISSHMVATTERSVCQVVLIAENML